MTNNKSMQYTCLFGGGAIRGTAYVGTVRAMEELGINPKILAGSSVGSVFAGLIALGYSANELEALFLRFNYEIFRDVHLSLGPNFALSKGEVFLDWIRDLIEQKYYGEKYGRVDFYWELSSKKVLQLTARGYLLKKKLNWYVQIKNMLSSSPYKGKNWKQNDNLALPPAENVREIDRGGRRI